MFRNKKGFLVLFAILLIIISSQAVFSQENDNCTGIENNQAIDCDAVSIDEEIISDCSENETGMISDASNSDNPLEHKK